MADDDDRVLIGAVDQGTSSTRFLIFDSANSELITYHQTEIKNFYPEDGWVETDPMEILNSVKLCIEKSIGNLKMLNISPSLIKAIGITNQRETTIAWDKQTGRPLYNAIVWLDTRTRQTVERLIEKSPGHNQFYLQPRCGLPISTYFSAVKMRWLLENCSEVQKAVELQRCCFGTVDSWLLWNLTGGSSGGKFFTDVTNASRTMLMNIHTLKWDPVLCKFFDIPQSVLPEIRTSAEIYGHLADTSLCGVPISGILGDQQAALVGQGCFDRGQVKNTYGTGCFVLCNTGSEVLVSDHGLVTTVAYQLGKGRAPCYALEGSVAIAGAAVRWLRENMNILLDKEEVETLALSVKDTGGCHFVPAFSGLFCPYWLSNSRGVICGLTQSTTRAHVARACLEAVCFQTKEVLDAMNRDCGAVIKSLKADGGMTNNNLLMQLQADILGINVVRASMPETTALGAAIAAGMAEGINAWEHPARATRDNSSDTFVPAILQTERDERFCWWKMAVTKSMNWEIGQNTEQANGVTSAVPYCMYVLLSFGIYVASELIVNKR